MTKVPAELFKPDRQGSHRKNFKNLTPFWSILQFSGGTLNVSEPSANKVKSRSSSFPDQVLHHKIRVVIMGCTQGPCWSYIALSVCLHKGFQVTWNTSLQGKWVYKSSTEHLSKQYARGSMYLIHTFKKKTNNKTNKNTPKSKSQFWNSK